MNDVCLCILLFEKYQNGDCGKWCLESVLATFPLL